MNLDKVNNQYRRCINSLIRGNPKFRIRYYLSSKINQFKRATNLTKRQLSNQLYQRLKNATTGSKSFQLMQG